MYRQPNETRKQLQIILYWDCWTSPQAEGQTLTIINDVPMDLHRLPPANRITVKRPANGSLGVFWCMCSCACLHAYLNSMHMTVLLLVMSYNENVERMLALTYHKKSANMSKFGGKCNLTTLQNSKPSKITGLLTTENRARAKCGGDKTKKKCCTNTDWRDNVLPPRSTTLCESTVWSNLPSIYTDVQNIRCLRKNRHTKHARTHVHTHKKRCNGLGTPKPNPIKPSIWSDSV